MQHFASLIIGDYDSVGYYSNQLNNLIFQQFSKENVAKTGRLKPVLTCYDALADADDPEAALVAVPAAVHAVVDEDDVEDHHHGAQHELAHTRAVQEQPHAALPLPPHHRNLVRLLDNDKYFLEIFLPARTFPRLHPLSRPRLHVFCCSLSLMNEKCRC